MTETKNTKAVTARFFVTIIICAVVGFFAGFSLFRLGKNFSPEASLAQIKTAVVLYTPYVALALNVIMAIVGFSLFGKCKKLADSWDGEDENTIDTIESSLTAPLTISTVMMILNFLFFGVSCGGVINNPAAYSGAVVTLLLSAAIMLLSFVWETALQGKVISLEKKLNPEKRGFILDRNFNKEWLESCDEAQKMIIYKASFDSHKALGSMFLLAFIVTFLCNIVFNTGIFATIIVTLLWLVQSVVYIRSAHKYENCR